MSETQQPQMVSDVTSQYQNNESFISTRLDTDKILRKLELFLGSKRVALVPDKENQTLVETMVEYGKPLCNEQGLNGIMHIVELMVNGQVVQGNFDDERYREYIFFARRELAVEIVTNRIKWGIKSEHTKMIIDSIMRFIKPFMSRLINNEERKSYIGGFQSREVVMRDNAKRGALSSFSSFGRN